jgi:ABC-type branched-subunit amino acid transport system permease subunit
MNWISANIVLIEGTIITLLLALSVQYPMRVGVFSFAGVGLHGIGGYTAGVAMTRLGFDTWPAVVMGTLVAASAGLLVSLAVYRLNGTYLAMATIAFDLVVVVAAGNLTDLTGGHTGLYGAFGQIELWHVLLIAVVVIAAFAFSETGGVSRRIEAVHDDPALAASMGINVGLHRLTSFVVSGSVAGLGGALLVLTRTTVTPEVFGFQLVVVALTVVVVGGSRSWVGVFLGAVIFTWLPEIIAFAGQWRSVVYGLIVATAAIYIPGGIWGSILRARRHLNQRSRTPPGNGQRDDEPLDLGEGAELMATSEATHER